MYFDVAHHAGIKHQAAKALYPFKTIRKDQTDLDDDLPLLSLVMIDEKALHAIYAQAG